MNKNIKKVILISILLLLSFSLWIYYKNENKILDTQKNNVDLLFAKNYISHVFEEDSVSFNIFAIKRIKETNDIPISKLISDITFNNENIKITNFSVDQGLISNGYQLINFIVDVEVSEFSIQKANKLTIFFNNKKIEHYNIGDITLQKNRINQNENTILNDDYTIGYPFPSLNFNIINNNKNHITLKNITDLNKNFNYNFPDSTKINQQENYNISVDYFTEIKKFDFYTITPILQYSLEDQLYYYNMPSVIFGILIPDEEKINIIIDSKKIKKE